MEYNFIFSFSKRSKKGDKNGKGLRHFSMKVCEKVQRKGTTSYNEVADELVSEFTNSNNHLAADSVGRSCPWCWLWKWCSGVLLWIVCVKLRTQTSKGFMLSIGEFCCFDFLLFRFEKDCYLFKHKGGQVFLKYLWGLLKEHTF